MQRTIDGLCVTIIRKSIKSMHLRVLSPNGEIQITAPNRLSVSQIDRFVREKRAWIAARQQQFLQRFAAIRLSAQKRLQIDPVDPQPHICLRCVTCKTRLRAHCRKAGPVQRRIQQLDASALLKGTSSVCKRPRQPVRQGRSRTVIHRVPQTPLRDAPARKQRRSIPSAQLSAQQYLRIVAVPRKTEEICDRAPGRSRK